MGTVMPPHGRKPMYPKFNTRQNNCYLYKLHCISHDSFCVDVAQQLGYWNPELTSARGPVRTAFVLAIWSRLGSLAVGVSGRSHDQTLSECGMDRIHYRARAETVFNLFRLEI